MEGGFSYGIVRQLIEPVRAAAGPGEWDGLLEGAAGLAARVFDWTEAGPVENDVPHAVMHGLYWLVANLAARRPLVIAIDDAHWADAPSLRWLAHLGARIEGLPVALLLAVRNGPDEPGDGRGVARLPGLHAAAVGAAGGAGDGDARPAAPRRAGR